ncbi:MAG: DAK2 domain-containing protein [Dehalococcoidia bacterium]|nr:DAK2 domain-containing protein [Dehalococcoidia bacterium]
MTDARVSAAMLRAAFEVAERWLAANRDGINAINVYPVPDGDTGTNMLLTVRAALREAPDAPLHVGELTARIARGALLGARGNSGVIWSQMLRGFAEHLAAYSDARPHDLIAALVNASRVSYAAVGQPVEGTMLTVLREAADAAHTAATSGLDDLALFHALVDEAYASVGRTPTLLPRLRDAGVVDSGGAGVAVLLEGIALGLGRRPLPLLPRYAGTEQVQTSAVEHEGHGYCTEFVAAIAPGSGVINRIAMERELVALGGESVLVVGDDHTVHVHVHLEDPGPAISLGAAAGALLSVKVENMQAQHEAWMGSHADAPSAEGAVGAEGGDGAHGSEHTGGTAGTASTAATSVALPPVALVAVARGAGIARAFRDLGASRIVDAGDGMKASAGELLEAARAAGAGHVLLLPNDRDVLMAAEAAAREAPDFLTVIPTRNAAAGLAAAIYYLPDGDAASMANEMRGVLDDIRCVEVSTAVRDASVDGVQVRRGQAIAFLDGRLMASCPTPDEALLAALADAVADHAELVTLYLGQGVSPQDGEQARTLIEAAHPSLEVEVLAGGQPHYPYLASVE